jgi:ABC-2 type transport system ATP-binding protein
MPPAVEIRNLHKTYGKTIAVDDISFEVHDGEIFGMVGPNGAGKTTTVECIEGLRQPDGGTLRVLGLDPRRDARILRARTGIQLQQSELPERMKVWEALDLYSSFYEHPADWKSLLVELGLEEKRNAVFAKLSGGQKQRLFIALALLPDPEVVFLDELTSGLDPQARHAIWDLVRAVRSRGKTIVLITHFMDEAERLCDRVAIVDRGRIVALDTPAALIRNVGAEERVVFRVNESLPSGFGGTLSGADRVEIQGERVVIHRTTGGSARQVPLVSEVVSQLTAQGIQFSELRTEEPSLEDVFLQLTGREIRELGTR